MQSQKSSVFCFLSLLTSASVFSCGSESLQAQPPMAADTDESAALPPLPAGEAIFVFPPETPRKMLMGVQIARGRQRVTAAQYYLRMLMQSQPTPEELLRLRDEFGVGTFLELNADSSLQPDAGSLLKLVNQASQVSIPSDERLDQLVAGLATAGKDSEAVILEILSANDRAVRPLLAADPATPSGSLAARLLASNVFELRRGLVDALDSADEATQLRIVRMLGYSADSQIAYDLLPLKFREDASEELRSVVVEACNRLLDRDVSSLTAVDASQLMNRETKRLLKLVGQRLPKSSSWSDRVDVAGPEKRAEILQRAIEIAADSVAADPSSNESKALLWLAELSATPADLTMSVPEHSSSSMTPEEFSAVANEAFSMGREFEALAGEANLLKLAYGRLQSGQSLELAPTALNSVLDSSDPRVRVLAAVASRSVKSGSSDVRSDRILTAAREAGVLPDAVVIDGNERLAGDLAASVSDAGYATRIARTGIDGFEIAVNSVSCSIVFVHASTGQWDVSGTVANLRADARTRTTPIIVYGPEYTRKSGERLAARYPGVWYISEPLLPVPSVTTPPITLADQLQLEGVPGPALSVDDLQALKGLMAIAQ